MNEVEAVFNLYEKKLYHVANAILNDSYAAEDAVIETFAKLLSGGYVIDDPESAQTKALLIRIVQSAAIDMYRRRKILSSDDALISAMAAVEEDADLRMTVDQLLNQLKPPYREVLTERFIHDRSVRDTAKVLGISEAAVRKRQERALTMLRKGKGVQML